MDIRSMIRDERAEFVVCLRGLTPGQWEFPSLCAGWRVRDVVAHVVEGSALSPSRIVAILVRSGLSVHRANAAAIIELASRSTTELVDVLERRVDVSGADRVLGLRMALRAIVIHQQDVRRPLGLHRDIPAERLVATLEHVLSRFGTINLGSRARAAGLRLRATDIGWTHGDGPEVAGPGEAVLMAICGRGAALPDLGGDGVSILAARTSRGA